MAAVALGIAQRVGHLMERLPSWREAGTLLRRSGSRGEQPAPLAGLIESEIIPRLLVAHRPAFRTPPGQTVPRPIAPGEPERFAQLLVARETCELLVEIEQLLDSGVPAGSLYLDLFAPAARVLGEGWDSDTYDFVDVTMALWRLQELVREVQSRTPEPRPVLAARRALFASVPGDQHSLGLILIEDFFRQAGWQTASLPDALEEDLVAAVAAERFDLIGLTVTQTDQLVLLPNLIAHLRRRSRQPDLRVMAGGAAIGGDAALAASLGADATAADARGAVSAAQALMGDAAAPRC